MTPLLSDLPSNGRFAGQETLLPLLAGAVEQTAESVVITDERGCILFVNPAFTRQTGYTREEALGRTPALLKSGLMSATFYDRLWGDIECGQSFRGVFINRRKDGSHYHEEKQISPMVDRDGLIRYYISTGRDVSVQIENETRLRTLANFDSLTGLPNRNLFLDRLTQTILRQPVDGPGFALLILDLDGFKKINDALGHDIGDALLCLVADRLSSVVPPQQTLARLGGDEFTILLESEHLLPQLHHLGKAIAEVLEAPFTLEGRPYYIGASIGVSRYPQDGRDASMLLKRADIALYRAKGEDKGRLRHFELAMGEEASAVWQLQNELQQAVEQHEFRLLYQPQMDAAHHRLVGVEALLRWQHPERGLLAPAEFLAVMEDMGLMPRLHRWLLTTACADLLALNLPALPRLSINLSLDVFQAPGLLDDTLAALDATGFPADRLEFEITESMLLENTEALTLRLQQLDALGIRVVIDDFGTGYSNLAFLRRLPIQGLKIDRSFVSDIGQSAEGESIVRTMLDLARALHLSVVAEGVEETPQRDFLFRHGCGTQQGYLYGRPQPPQALLSLVACHGHPAPASGGLPAF